MLNYIRNQWENLPEILQIIILLVGLAFTGVCCAVGAIFALLFFAAIFYCFFKTMDFAMARAMFLLCVTTVGITLISARAFDWIRYELP